MTYVKSQHRSLCGLRQCPSSILVQSRTTNDTPAATLDWVLTCFFREELLSYGGSVGPKPRVCAESPQQTIIVAMRLLMTKPITTPSSVYVCDSPCLALHRKALNHRSSFRLCVRTLNKTIVLTLCVNSRDQSILTLFFEPCAIAVPTMCNNST